ncbi:MAG TPA: arginine N-succinyltransferase, partial [Nitrosomonas sp.]|nr:arginine N-succinyltransferase [Nitrosomonas sp.]
MNWSQIFMIVLLTMLITIGGTYWVLKNYVFTTRFTPVELNEKEEKSLHEKLLSIGFLDENTDRPDSTNDQEIDHEGFLKPEAYSEHNAPREIIFTERELNALLAKNTDLAQKLAIDLANNLVSAKLLIPLEE